MDRQSEEPAGSELTGPESTGPVPATIVVATPVELGEAARLRARLAISRVRLDASRDELKLTVAELEVSNRDLDAASAELESLNAELKSVGSELHDVIDDLRQRSVELSDMIQFRDNVFANLGMGIVVLDPDGSVRVWNGASEELWGVAGDAARGEQLAELDIGLPVASLLPLIDKARRQRVGGEITVAATDRRGRSLRCRVVVTPLDGSPDAQPVGVVLLLEEEPGTGRGSWGATGNRR